MLHNSWHHFLIIVNLFPFTQRRDIVLTVILWMLVIVVRLLFLYGVIWERFWLCLCFAVISFGHIVIKATSAGPHFPWISIIATALVTIVSLLYVMDLFLIRQDQQERQQSQLWQAQQQAQLFNNNKPLGTLV